MAMFAWKESFRTGVGHIDDQHRQFFYLLNELDLAIEQRREGDILGLLLRDLDRYVRVHFRTEEMLMEGIGYPDLESHRKSHEFFAEQLAILKGRHERGDERVGKSALEFLRDWFTNHILTEDRKYGEFLFAGRLPLPEYR